MANSTLTDNLVSWWDFNSESPQGFIADQHGSNPLVISGVTISGGAMNVPGTCSSPDMGAKDFHTAPSVFNPNSQSFTVAALVKFNSIDENHEIISKWTTEDGGWRLFFNFAEGEISFMVQSPGGTAATSQNFPVIATGQYYAILAWCDASIGKIYVQVDHNSVAISETAVGFAINPTLALLVAGAGSHCDLTTNPLNGSIKQASYWNRILTANERNELWNNGDWLDYNDLKKNIEIECRELKCCPPDQFEVPVQVQCFPCDTSPEVGISPASGSSVEFPLIVFLTSNITGASIYFTTDGSEPSIESTLYEAPITLTSQVQLVRAFAVVEGCPDGTESMASYVTSPMVAQLSFGCARIDKCGQWGVFAPDGLGDYHWKLQTILSVLTPIKRIEMYQVNSLGIWDTGQAWSTDEFINPDEGPPNFHVFPLVLFNGGQVNAAYTSDFSLSHPTHIAAGAQTYDLYGEPVSTLSGYFKCILFWGDGTKTITTISTVCSDPPPPPPCELPAAPVLTTFCYGIDVTFHELPGLEYKLFRRMASPVVDVVFHLIDSGIVATNPQTYHDTGVSPGEVWCYLLQVKYPFCDYGSSVPVCISVPCKPEITLSIDKTSVCPGDTITLTWNSRCIVGDLTSSWDDPKTGNVGGSESILIPADTVLDEICYTLEGGNACESTSKEVCVTIGHVPTTAQCLLLNIVKVKIDGYTDTYFFPYTLQCDLSGYGNHNPPNAKIWGGEFGRERPDACQFGGDITYSPFSVPSDITYFNDGCVITQGAISLNPSDRWLLQISALIEAFEAVIIWSGEKTCGSDPTGTYVKTGGCATGPASLAIKATP